MSERAAQHPGAYHLTEKAHAALADPWATGLPPEARALTRQDRVEIAARALMGYPTEHVWSDADLAPVSPMGDDTARGIFTELAADALDAAYPVLVSADELDALPQGAVIVSEAGRVYRREHIGGLGRVNGADVGTLEVWEQPGERETGRKIRRVTSTTLAVSGPWTVVWTRVAA